MSSTWGQEKSISGKAHSIHKDDVASHSSGTLGDCRQFPTANAEGVRAGQRTMRLEGWTEPARMAVGHVACWKVCTLPWTHVSPVWLVDDLLGGGVCGKADF